MDPFLLIVCVVTGVSVAGIALSNTYNIESFFVFVESDLRERLRSLRITTPNLRRWLVLWLAIVAITFFMVWLGLQMPGIAFLLVVFMCAGPWYVVRKLAADRRRKIEEQLADAMVMFSSAVRAGLSLAQALELLGNECPVPIKQEFQQLSGEYKLGKPLERTLNEAKERLNSENFILFAAALLASRESGGRLNETVERIATSVLELQRLERKIRSETAQARKSAVYMAIAPVGILAMYAMMDPDNVKALYDSFPGQVVMCTAIVLNVIAYFWAVKILDADI